MRSLTGPELAIIADPEGHWEFLYLEVTNFDGTWINLGALAIGEATGDFQNTHSLSDDIDRNTLTFTATMRREIGAYSLVPFRTDSPLNVDDLGDYQPLLDLHREWRLWISIQPRHTFPTGEADFREWARGIVDRIDIQGEPATISVQGRGPEADLIDSLILCSEEDPVTFTAGPVADVLQAMLDFQFPATYTLVADGSAPSTFINELELTEPVSFWQKFSDVAAVGTGVVRFLYASDDTLAIHLFTPNRSATVPDWTIDGHEYERLDVGIALDTIANYAIGRFVNSSGAIQQVTSPATPVSASISRYGLRPIVITFAPKEGIDETNIQALLDAIVSDRELPIMEQAVQGTGLWFGGLWDYVGLTANGVHYDEDQAGGVTGYTQTSENGVITSVFQLRGKPAGRYATWLQISSPTAPSAADIAPAITSYDAAYWETYDIDGTPIAGGVGDTGTVNDFVNSVAIEVGTDPTFATVEFIEYTDVTPGGDFRHQWEGASRATPYYFRATPWTGPLSAGLPTGTAGAVSLARAFSGPAPTDTPTFVWDRSDPQQLRGDVVAGSGTVIGDIASTLGQIGIPTLLLQTIEDDQWLALSTIPTAETEVGTEYRTQSYAVGAGSVRVGANIKAKTGTPTIGANYSLDGFSTKPSLVSFTPAGTGVRYSGWTAMPSPAKADIGLTWSVGAGADTAALDLYRVWIEYLPSTVAGGRVHVAAFAAAFN